MIRHTLVGSLVGFFKAGGLFADYVSRLLVCSCFNERTFHGTIVLCRYGPTRFFAITEVAGNRGTPTRCAPVACRRGTIRAGVTYFRRLHGQFHCYRVVVGTGRRPGNVVVLTGERGQSCGILRVNKKRVLPAGWAGRAKPGVMRSCACRLQGRVLRTLARGRTGKVSASALPVRD